MLKMSSNKDEIIALEIEVTKSCNLKCSYCCADTQIIKNKLDDELKFNYYKKIIDFLDTKNNKISYIINGGETTNFSKLEELIKLINESKNYYDCILLTNLTNKLPPKNINFKNNYIVTSIHKQYTDLYPIIFDNINKLNMNGRVNFNIILDDFYNNKNKNKILEIANIIKKTNNYITLQILNNNIQNYKEYDLWHNLFVENGFDNFFDDIYANYFINDAKVSIKEIRNQYHNHNNNFFNCMCYTKNYMILEDLTLREDCGLFKKLGNISENFDILNEIKIKKRMCPYKNCDSNSTPEVRKIILK